MTVTGDESGSAALEAVRDVIADVRRRGDAALRELTERFDGARLDTVRVPEQDIKEAAATAPQGLLDAMHEAAARIRAFAEHQRVGRSLGCGCGHRRKLGKANARLFHRAANDTVEQIDMGARRDLRHHAAEGGVFLGLRADDIGQNPPRPVTQALDHAGCGFIAGGLDAQYQHWHIVTQFEPLRWRPKRRFPFPPRAFSSEACPGLDPGWIPVRMKKTRQKRFRARSVLI